MSTTTRMSAIVIHPCAPWSGAPGMRPIQAANSAAAALPASAGHPSWKNPMRE
jgi:hypothetical protein